MFGDYQFTRSLSVNLPFPTLPRRTFFNEAQRFHLLRDSGSVLLCVGSTEGWQHQWLDFSAVALPAGTCKITYTSGSTGSPKGVCLSQAQQQRTVEALAERIGSLDVQQHLCTMPLAVLLENLAGVYLGSSRLSGEGGLDFQEKVF